MQQIIHRLGLPPRDAVQLLMQSAVEIAARPIVSGPVQTDLRGDLGDLECVSSLDGQGVIHVIVALIVTLEPR
jgi:hypothetical protein